MKLLLLQFVALSTQLAPQEYLDRWARNLFIEYTVVNNLVRTTEFDYPANEDESAFEFRISITNTGTEELNLQPHWSIYFYHRNWFSSLIPRTLRFNRNHVKATPFSGLTPQIQSTSLSTLAKAWKWLMLTANYGQSPLS